jgi:Tol biopolymer transport system component
MKRFGTVVLAVVMLVIAGCGGGGGGGGSSDASSTQPAFITGAIGNIDYWPRFSPDGQTILFTRCAADPSCSIAPTGGPFALFKIAVTGGEATPLFTPPAGFAATRPDWSWNEDLASGQIAFAYTDVAETFSELWLIDQDGSSPLMVPTLDHASYPSFFPDGASVSVEVPHMPGPFLEQIAVPSGTILATQNVLWTGESAVSRDGSMLALAAQEPIAGGQYDDAKNLIWIENSDGSDLRMLDGLEGRTPNWSPHDTLVEFESNRNCGKSKNYAIFVERPTGGRAHQLTDCAFNANHAVWSPDGKRLALAIELPGTGSLTPGGWWGLAVMQVRRGIHP